MTFGKWWEEHQHEFVGITRHAAKRIWLAALHSRYRVDMKYIWHKDGAPFGGFETDSIEEAAATLCERQAHRRLVRDFTSETLIVFTSHNGHKHTLSKEDVTCT